MPAKASTERPKLGFPFYQALRYNLGLTSEEIAGKIEHLTLAQIHKALTYCHANRDEMTTTSQPSMRRPKRSFPVAPSPSEPSQKRYSTGEQIRRLLRLICSLSGEAMCNRVEFLGRW